jgi:hypothetical protein
MPSDLPPQESLSGSRAVFIQWLVIGVAGVAFVFVASAHLPDTIKLPGVLTVGLGLAAGWVWGRLGQSLHLPIRRFLFVVVWFTIAGAEILGSWKNHQDRAEYLQEKWQPLVNDPVAQAVRESLSQDRDDESPEDREMRMKQLAKLDQADAIRWRRLEFHGYLASRVVRLNIRGLTSAPWPELIWGTEILLGSALGTWLGMSVLQTRSPPSSK